MNHRSLLAATIGTLVVILLTCMVVLMSTVYIYSRATATLGGEIQALEWGVIVVPVLMVLVCCYLQAYVKR